MELTWQQHRSYFDITGYVISRCRIYTIDTVTTTIGAMETSLSITGLTPGVTYIFTVRAMSKTLRSGPSKPIQVTLEENVEVQSSQWWAWHQVCLVGVVIFCMVCVVRRRGSIARECSNCHRRCIISWRSTNYTSLIIGVYPCITSIVLYSVKPLNKRLTNAPSTNDIITEVTMHKKTSKNEKF